MKHFLLLLIFFQTFSNSFAESCNRADTSDHCRKLFAEADKQQIQESNLFNRSVRISFLTPALTIPIKKITTIPIAIENTGRNVYTFFGDSCHPFGVWEVQSEAAKDSEIFAIGDQSLEKCGLFDHSNKPWQLTARGRTVISTSVTTVPRDDEFRSRIRLCLSTSGLREARRFNGQVCTEFVDLIAKP